MVAPLNLADVRAVAAIMAEFELDEYASEHFTLKKSRHKLSRAEPTERELLEQHLKPLPAEPWNDVPQEAADAWAQGHAPPSGPDT